MNAMQASKTEAIEMMYCEQCKLGGFMRSLCPVTCTVAQLFYRENQVQSDQRVTLLREVTQ
jgi:hypothetical protein